MRNELQNKHCSSKQEINVQSRIEHEDLSLKRGSWSNSIAIIRSLEDTVVHDMHSFEQSVVRSRAYTSSAWNKYLGGCTESRDISTSMFCWVRDLKIFVIRSRAPYTQLSAPTTGHGL